MLENLLLPKKKAILKKWFDLIVETYPEETSRFLRREKDPFANPVGSTIAKGIEEVFEELLKGNDTDRFTSFLDRIIRVRAIQDFTPSQAIAFIFLLKKVVREEAEKEIREKNLSDELVRFESKIDALALLSFDIYMKCREKLYEVRANEVKNRYLYLLKRANLLYEIPEQGSEEHDDVH